MKLLKKASLAAAIAAAPFAAQALQPVDDMTLSNTTGQSGVTIEIDIEGAGITVGEIEYTDTASIDDPATAGVDESLDIDTTGDGNFDTSSGGGILLQNLAITNVNNLVQKIDVTAEGDLFISQSGANGVSISLGDVAGAANNDYSAVALKGSNGTAELVDSLSMNLDLGESTIRIHNLADGSTLATAGVTGAHAASTSSVAIQMASSIKINDLDAQIFGYTQAQADAKAAATTVGDLDGNSTPNEASDKAIYAAALADGGAVTITDLTFNNNGNAATINQTIWADSAGVYIQMGAIEGDLTIGDLGIGTGANGQALSVGQLAVRDINLSGMTQRISGH